MIFTICLFQSNEQIRLIYSPLSGDTRNLWMATDHIHCTQIAPLYRIKTICTRGQTISMSSIYLPLSVRFPTNCILIKWEEMFGYETFSLLLILIPWQIVLWSVSEDLRLTSRSLRFSFVNDFCLIFSSFLWNWKNFHNLMTFMSQKYLMAHIFSIYLTLIESTRICHQL